MRLPTICSAASTSTAAIPCSAGTPISSPSADDLVLPMYTILRGGGLRCGGFNFDAKRRRQSIDPEDLFHAHIGGIDTLARALRHAARLIEDGALEDFVDQRYAGWDDPFGKSILAGKQKLADLADHVARN